MPRQTTSNWKICQDSKMTSTRQIKRQWQHQTRMSRARMSRTKTSKRSRSRRPCQPGGQAALLQALTFLNKLFMAFPLSKSPPPACLNSTCKTIPELTIEWGPMTLANVWIPLTNLKPRILLVSCVPHLKRLFYDSIFFGKTSFSSIAGFHFILP